VVPSARTVVLDTLTLRRALRAPARPIRIGESTIAWLEAWQPALLIAVAATCAVSVFVAELLLALAVLAFIARLVSGRTQIHSFPLAAPIVAFAVWTVLSASFAQDPVAAHEDAKKLVLFAVVWLALDSFRSREARERAVDAVLLGGIVLSAGCLVQFYLMGFDTLNNRPMGFLGHYMTSAGVSMAAIVLASARILFAGSPSSRPDRHDWLRLAAIGTCVAAAVVLNHYGLLPNKAQRGALAIVLALTAFGLARGTWSGPGTSALLARVAAPICAWALLVSQTRSAWLGTVAGLAVVLFLWAPRALAVLPVGVAFAIAVGPSAVLDRLTITDDSSRDRYYMWQAGIDMVAERPIFGLGPGQVEELYPHYRWRGAPNVAAPHLHDNMIQIAAERGLPCLAFFFWMVIVAMRDALREARRGARGEGWIAIGALAVWTAVMAGGLFEYNFGDSEILLLLLVVAAAPYALKRERDTATVPASAPA